jgi:hypothetical protein
MKDQAFSLLLRPEIQNKAPHCCKFLCFFIPTMCTFTRFLTADLRYDRLFALRLSSRSPVSSTISASISSIRSRIDTRLRDLALSIDQIKSNSKDKEHQGTAGQRDSRSGK